MSAHDCGVHRDDPVKLVVGVGLGHQRREHPPPGAIDGPHPQSVVDASPAPVLLRQMDPLRSRPDLPQPCQIERGTTGNSEGQQAPPRRSAQGGNPRSVAT